MPPRPSLKKRCPKGFRKSGTRCVRKPGRPKGSKNKKSPKKYPKKSPRKYSKKSVKRKSPKKSAKRKSPKKSPRKSSKKSPGKPRCSQIKYRTNCISRLGSDGMRDCRWNYTSNKCGVLPVKYRKRVMSFGRIPRKRKVGNVFSKLKPGTVKNLAEHIQQREIMERIGRKTEDWLRKHQEEPSMFEGMEIMNPGIPNAPPL